MRTRRRVQWRLHEPMNIARRGEKEECRQPTCGLRSEQIGTRPTLNHLCDSAYQATDVEVLRVDHTHTRVVSSKREQERGEEEYENTTARTMAITCTDEYSEEG